MFGYVTTYKPELKIKEFEAYKGVYCTLCKEMGKEYGALSRFLLSYDCSFYVIYKMAISDNKISASKSRCSFNPCKKCMKITCDSDVYKLASAITVILAYFKVVDNIHDSGFFKKILLYLVYPYFAWLKRKAIKKYPDIFNVIKTGMDGQFEVESKENSSLDMSAHHSADMLGYLLSYGETDEKAAFARQFGYQLGRVIYFLDAFDDYADDMKKGTYNPFRNCDNIIDEASRTINLSIGELTKIFKQQKLYDFEPIIQNIIYEGLSNQLDRIVNKYRGERVE